MDPEIKQQLEEQGRKLDAIFQSTEKTRKYFLIIIWVSVIAFVLPLVGLIFAVPSFMSNYVNVLGGNL